MLDSKEMALDLVDEYLNINGYLSTKYINTEDISREVYYSYKLIDLGIDEDSLVDITEWLSAQMDLELEVCTRCTTINDLCNSVRTKIRYGNKYV